MLATLTGHDPHPLQTVMAANRRSTVVYQPRSRRAAFADALADARFAVVRALKIALLRGAGALVFVASCAGLVALATFSPGDASLEQCHGCRAIELAGRFRRHGRRPAAADVRHCRAGVPRLAGQLGRTRDDAAARSRGRCGARWLGRWQRCSSAGGLGLLPKLEALPAGTGGLFGLAVVGLSRHAGNTYQQPWLAFIAPLLLLALGLPLAFFSAGVKFRPLWRGMLNVPAFLVWAFHLLPPLRARELTRKSANSVTRTKRKRSSRKKTPEGLSAAAGADCRRHHPRRRAPPRNPRQARGEASSPRRPRRARQPALNLGSSRIPAAAAGLAGRAGAAARRLGAVRRSAGRKRPHAGSGAGRFRRARAASWRCAPARS